jgi:hypothetical protein
VIDVGAIRQATSLVVICSTMWPLAATITPYCLSTSNTLGMSGGPGDFLADGGEYLRGKASLAIEFEHLAATGAVAKAVQAGTCTSVPGMHITVLPAQLNSTLPLRT